MKNKYSFLIEREFWEDEEKLGRMMKETILKLRNSSDWKGYIKEYDGFVFIISPVEPEDLK